MKHIKKLAALAIALAAVLALSVTAWAAASLSNGVVAGSDGAALDKSVQIAKSIKAFNPDETTINGPSMSYSYTITSGTAGIQIIDSSNVSVLTKAGAQPSSVTLTGTSANTIAWTTDDQLTASSDGADNTRYLTVNFSGVTFTGAGVYRYVITETATAAAYTASGVTRGASGSAAGDPAVYTETRYLDVYVRDAREGETGFQIYGYVLASDNSTQPQTDSNKLSSFTTDNYVTSNVTISKTLNNDSAMNSHEFPFHVAFSGTTVAATEMKKNDTADTTADMTAGQATDFVKIASGQSVKYIGIPAGTTVSAYETNDVVGTTYASSATVTTTGTNAASKNISWTTENVNAYAVYTQAAYNSNQASVTTTTTAANFTEPFINTLVLISPTGLVFRVAPYVAMLCVGVPLFVVMTRRRKQTAR